MATTDSKIPDFSSETCTNLMIQLKILIRKTPAGQPVKCYVRRDQRDTIEEPFSKCGFEVTVRKSDTNLYLVTLLKKTG